MARKWKEKLGRNLKSGDIITLKFYENNLTQEVKIKSGPSKRKNMFTVDTIWDFVLEDAPYWWGSAIVSFYNGNIVSYTREEWK